MKILHIFKNYSTKILLISLLVVMMLLSVTNFDKKYNEQMKQIEDIHSSDSISIKISSFPVVKNGKLSFCGVVKHEASGEPEFSIVLKNFDNIILSPGDSLIIKDFVYFRPEKSGNEGGFDSASYFKSRNLCGTIYSEVPPGLTHRSRNIFFRSLNKLHQNVTENIDRYFRADYAGIVKALVTGERYGISDKTENNLKVSGVYHIVAISGLHLNIFIVLISGFIASLKIKRRKKAVLSAVICGVSAVFVLTFTGFGLSVLRAFVMLVISLGSGIFSRKYNAKNALMLAAAIIVIVAPASWYSIGFILSVLSTLAVLISAEITNYVKEANSVPRVLKCKLTPVFITSALCSLFTLPVMMHSFNFLPLYSAIANFVILPAVSPALIMSVIFCASSAIGAGFISVFISSCVTALVHYIDKASQIITSMPLARLNLYPLYTAQLLILLICCALFIYFTIRKAKKFQLASVLFFIVAAGTFLVYNGIDKDAKLIFADTGQGECSIIRLNDGSAIMIDCGSSDTTEYIGDEIRSTLIKNNIRSLSGVFISHYHGDHVSEVASLLDEGLAENIYMPALYNKDSTETFENRQKLIHSALKNNAGIINIKSGEKTELNNDCTMEVLMPQADMFMSDNNLSAVLKFTYGNTKILFTGDIEKEATAELIEKDIDCDILKVPHHGGKNELTEDLLKKTSPEYALIGCGENNVYKHPDADTVRILEKCGVRVYRTDRDGSVSVFFDRDKIKKLEKMR